MSGFLLLASAMSIVASPAGASDVPPLQNGIEQIWGGVMTLPSKLQVDFDTGAVTLHQDSVGSMSATETKATARQATAAEIDTLRRLANNFATSELARDACPSLPDPAHPGFPPVPKAPIADSIQWIYVVRDGARSGGILRTEYCPTLNTKRLIEQLRP